MKRVKQGAATTRRQSGFSLVEAAVALMIAGVAAVGFWQTMGIRWAEENSDRVNSQMTRAEAAAASFAGMYGRLPCPASGPSGVEVCTESDGAYFHGWFPYATVGLPQPELGKLKYAVRADLIATDGWAFRALVNSKPIGLASGPDAKPRSLEDLVANTYDHVLDLCATLSQVAAGSAGPLSALEITTAADDLRMAGLGQGQRLAVSAAQVSGHLGCGPIVAVSGRGQYNAHLSGAIMAKSAQDFREQLELSYAIYVLEVAEGAWSVGSHTYGMLMDWAKFPQTVSAIHAKFYSPGLAGAIATSAQAIVTKAMGLASWGARVSNLARFSNNLVNYREHLRIANELVDTSLANYAKATENAMLGSTSAYFLREQSEPAVLPPPPGVASKYGENGTAQGMLAKAQDRATGLGQGPALSAHPSLPDGPPREKLIPEEGILDVDGIVGAMGGRSETSNEPLISVDPGDIAGLRGQIADRQKDALGFDAAARGQLDPELSSYDFGSGKLDPDNFDPETYDAGAYDPKTFDPKAFDASKQNWSAYKKFIELRGFDIPADPPPTSPP
ncbi:type IV pilus modification PilV family protein [Hydrogenophaga sp.]|uniref:type IV pilus modification PilV family protein n=1 Tax=Hydrogenophaga sp. TaxID=1904254 RepID=UPI003F71B4CA